MSKTPPQRRPRPKLFTFVIEVSGSTLIEQVEAASVAAAVKKWSKRSLTRAHFSPEEISEPPVRVERRPSVWCISLKDGLDGRFFLVHIIQTVRTRDEMLREVVHSNVVAPTSRDRAKRLLRNFRRS